MILYKSNHAINFIGHCQLLYRQDLWANETDKIAKLIHFQLPKIFTVDHVKKLIENKEQKPRVHINDCILKVEHHAAYTFMISLNKKGHKTYFHLTFGNLKSDWRLWDTFNFIP